MLRKIQDENKCLIFRLDKEKRGDEVSDLVYLLKKEGFDFLDRSRSRACFCDGNFDKFRDLVKEFVKKKKIEAEVFRMTDPGMGLNYEWYVKGNPMFIYPDFTKVKIPEEIDKYEKIFYNK
jgi:hypothetical protein